MEFNDFKEYYDPYTYNRKLKHNIYYEMAYDYNGNLDIEERINKIVAEMKKVYPYASNFEEAAWLEGTISEKVSVNFKLQRIFNLMYVNRYDEAILKSIFNSYIQTLIKYAEDNDLDYKYVEIIPKIRNAINGTDYFPEEI